MSDFNLVELNGEFVVDSRLVAESLSISVKSFHETIRNYQTDIEETFGQLPFETATVVNSVGAVNETVFYLLNEDQATFLMTLSRNSEAVVKAKLQLVKAFRDAKELVMKLMQEKLDSLEKQNKAEKHLKKANALLIAAKKENPVIVLEWIKTIACEHGLVLDDSGSKFDYERATKQTDNMSLAANRIGLALNKSIKVVDRMHDQMDIGQVMELRQQACDAVTTMSMQEIEIRRLCGLVADVSYQPTIDRSKFEHQILRLTTQLNIAQNKEAVLTELCEIMEQALRTTLIVYSKKVCKEFELLFKHAFNVGTVVSMQELIKFLADMKTKQDNMMNNMFISVSNQMNKTD